MVEGDILKCRNCPYGKEDFERRMCWYEKIMKERGIPNNIYKHLQPEQFLWCDKVGGKVYWDYRCEDAYPKPVKQKNHSKQKKRNKRERDLKHKNHLKFLAENVSGSPVIYMDYIWIKGQGYVENPKPYYKRLYRGSNHRGTNRYKYYKKYANRCVRRYKGEIHKGSMFKKVFDYAWSVD